MAPTLYITSLILALTLISTAGAANAPPLVRSSCLHASFPSVCLNTLSSYPGAARTPTDLAKAAVSVSFHHASRTTDYLTDLRRGGGRKSAALGDCLEQLADAAAQLRDTLRELQSLKTGGAFGWHMSNAETWVSAALTDQETCLDGIGEVGGAGKAVSDDVLRKIRNVGKVTSNALYLINRLKRD